MATNDNIPAASRYPATLPALYQAEDGGDFLGRFLLAFEQLMSGFGDAAQPGIEEILDGTENESLAGVEHYFDPRQAPEGFLPWLAGWVALDLREDFGEQALRNLIENACSLYPLRGTRQGIEKLLHAYSGEEVTVHEALPFQVGVVSRLGKDTRLGGGVPHFFRVEMRLPIADARDLHEQGLRVRAIIDMVKPAHTFYELKIKALGLQIDVRSTIGVDTLLSETPPGVPRGLPGDVPPVAPPAVERFQVGLWSTIGLENLRLEILRRLPPEAPGFQVGLRSTIGGEDPLRAAPPPPPRPLGPVPEPPIAAASLRIGVHSTIVVKARRYQVVLPMVRGRYPADLPPGEVPGIEGPSFQVGLSSTIGGDGRLLPAPPPPPEPVEPVAEPEIESPTIRLGVRSTIGSDSRLSEIPWRFLHPQPVDLEPTEPPVETPSLRIGVRSTIGLDCLLSEQP